MQENACYLSGVYTFVRVMDCKDVGGEHTDWVHWKPLLSYIMESAWWWTPRFAKGYGR